MSVRQTRIHAACYNRGPVYTSDGANEKFEFIRAFVIDLLWTKHLHSVTWDSFSNTEEWIFFQCIADNVSMHHIWCLLCVISTQGRTCTHRASKWNRPVSWIQKCWGRFYHQSLLPAYIPKPSELSTFIIYLFYFSMVQNKLKCQQWSEPSSLPVLELCRCPVKPVSCDYKAESEDMAPKILLALSGNFN